MPVLRSCGVRVTLAGCRKRGGNGGWQDEGNRRPSRSGSWQVANAIACAACSPGPGGHAWSPGSRRRAGRAGDALLPRRHGRAGQAGGDPLRRGHGADGRRPGHRARGGFLHRCRHRRAGPLDRCEELGLRLCQRPAAGGALHRAHAYRPAQRGRHRLCRPPGVPVRDRRPDGRLQPACGRRDRGRPGLCATLQWRRHRGLGARTCLVPGAGAGRAHPGAPARRQGARCRARCHPLGTHCQAGARCRAPACLPAAAAGRGAGAAGAGRGHCHALRRGYARRAPL
ncbi:hypothetical protein D9M72_243870 [compost metagenome]